VRGGCEVGVNSRSGQQVLTPDVRDAIVGAVRTGASPEACAESVGVSARVFAGWLARGEDAEAVLEERGSCGRSERPFLELVRLVREARAAAELEAVGAVMDAARSDWRAAAWCLERLNPGVFGSQRRNLGGRPRGAVSAPDRRARPTGAAPAGGGSAGGEPPRVTRVDGGGGG
jgi:hypothetical protein